MKVELIKIIRSTSKLNTKLINKKNVIGYDLKLPYLKTVIIQNDKYFKKSLNNISHLIKK